MGTGRFERLERERRRDEAPAARPSVEARFGGAPAPRETEAGPSHSGAGGARFEDPATPERIRVLDMDGGQSFVRCAACRADNFVNATRCTTCEADLLTQAQRAFNESLWRKLSADKQEEDREVAALRERRAGAEREQNEAMRRRQQIELDLEHRRARGLPLDESDDVSDPLRYAAGALGRTLGRTVGRLFPGRNARLAAAGVAVVVAASLVVAYPRVVVVALGVAVALAGLAERVVRRYRRL